MIVSAPAAQGGQRLNLNLDGTDHSKKRKNPLGKNRQEILDELARKWVRFGCCDTPNEAMRLLLGGAK